MAEQEPDDNESIKFKNWKISEDLFWRVDEFRSKQRIRNKYEIADRAFDFYLAFATLAEEDRQAIINAAKANSLFTSEVAKQAKKIVPFTQISKKRLPKDERK